MQDLIATISRLMAEMEHIAVQEAEFGDLSMRQVLYLQTILMLERPTFGDLAEKLGVSKPTVTSVIQKLIQKGYVRKAQSPDDGRVYHIVPTSKGQAFAALHEDIHRRLARFLTRNLDDGEEEMLAVLLNKALH
jgi:DNA-binding MarR family transcriptional regulator